MFGDWTNKNNLNKLHNDYINADPFPHVVIPNFFTDELANKIDKEYPDMNETWHKYYNPIEIKYTFDDTSKMPSFFQNIFNTLNGDEFIEYVKQISDIQDLEYDPYLHGGGLHYHPVGGKLNMHLDYSINPRSGKERRLNLIFFLNKDWNYEDGGCTELWNSDMTKCIKKVLPAFNTALIFRTTDDSWHGLPERTKRIRRSMAVYYLSPPRKDVIHRSKAQFVCRPEYYDERMDRLNNLRCDRRLTDEDLLNIWPNWECELS